jgi:hypothetical protein
MNQIIALNNGTGLYATAVFQDGGKFVLQTRYDGEVLTSSEFGALSEAVMQMTLNWAAEYEGVEGGAHAGLVKELKVG